MVNEGAGEQILPNYTISQCTSYARAIRAVHEDLFSSVRIKHEDGLLGLIDLSLCKCLQHSGCWEVARCYEKLLRYHSDWAPSGPTILPRSVCGDEGYPLYGVLKLVAEFTK